MAKYGDKNSDSYNKYFAENITKEELEKLDNEQLKKIYYYNTGGLFQSFAFKRELKKVNTIS